MDAEDSLFIPPGLFDDDNFFLFQQTLNFVKRLKIKLKILSKNITLFYKWEKLYFNKMGYKDYKVYFS